MRKNFVIHIVVKVLLTLSYRFIPTNLMNIYLHPFCELRFFMPLPFQCFTPFFFSVGPENKPGTGWHLDMGSGPGASEIDFCTTYLPTRSDMGWLWFWPLSRSRPRIGIGIGLLVPEPGVTCYRANGQQTARPT